MPAALQRNNFRCQADGPKSPQVMALMSAGSAAMGGSTGSGNFHADYPSRQRKRLQVGTTNLSKAASSTEDGSHPNPGPTELNPSASIDRICETNVGAMKATLDSPQFKLPSHRRKATNGIMPLILRTETRRLSTSINKGNLAMDEIKNGNVIPELGLTSEGIGHAPSPISAAELHEVCSGRGTDNIYEDFPDGSQRSGFNHPRTETSATQKGAIQDEKKSTLSDNRTKLYEVFMEKYGSMRAVFRAFDNDGNGMISAQRFQDMVEAAEVDLTPAETRALYQSADANGDNTVAFQEFVHMFTPNTATISAYSPEKNPFDPARDPSSSLAVKYRSPMELSPRSRRKMRQLRTQITDELYRKQGLALGVHGGKPEQLLSYAFKNVDSDNDGFLSYGEVEHALGRGFLHLEGAISPNDLREMLQLMDRNGDERISLREFVQYFAIGEREVATDLIDNARKKELAALHAKRSVELTPREDVDPLFAQRREAAQEQHPPVKTHDIDGCLPEQLCKRTVAAVQACNLTGPPFPKSTSQMPTHKNSMLSNAPSSLQLELDRRPATSYGPGGPTVATLFPVSPDRFWYRRQERTDWTRVGVGGNGTNVDSTLYQPPLERFVTTNGELYSPLFRAPPSLKTVMNDDSFTILRSGKPLTAVEEEARSARRATRFERTQMRLNEYEEAHAQAERLKDWKSRANIRKIAGERFSYIDTLQEREHRISSREDRMQRRHGGQSFLRMWAGSPDSQFNAQNQQSD